MSQVRPGAVGAALPDTPAARRRGALRGLPPPLPAVRVRRRRPLPRRGARHGLQVSHSTVYLPDAPAARRGPHTKLTALPPQRPAAEPAAGAAEAAGGPGGGRAVRAGRALAPRAALAAGRRRRPHAAPLRVAGGLNYWASYIAALQYNTYNNKYTYDNTALYSLSLLIPVYFQFLRCLRGATEILILRLLHQ